MLLLSVPTHSDRVIGHYEEAQTAIAKLNAYQLGGRALTVNEARPKPEYAGGGFGGGYGAGSGRRRSEPRW